MYNYVLCRWNDYSDKLKTQNYIMHSSAGAVIILHSVFIMPVIKESSYHAPFLLSGSHLQTIYPSYFAKAEQIDYTREKMPTADNDYIYLDWAQVNKDARSEELVIIFHGLCGGTMRHYVTSTVHAFREIGIDCMAWNYRVTGRVENATAKATTSDSTDEVEWVVNNAIEKGYKHIYLVGFSMGANLVMLYLGRDAKSLPAQVNGGIGICGTIDIPVCTEHIETELFGVYQKHFVKDLCNHMRHKHEEHPEMFSIDGIDDIKSFKDFDNHFTAPIMGYHDANEYYVHASACAWLKDIKTPALLIQPKNDPFLDGQCYPIEAAEKSNCLYLEMPDSGGHCGFITPHNQLWWPAARSRQFVIENIRPSWQEAIAH